MKIKYEDNYESMSKEACHDLVHTIKVKPNAVICLATGSSPKRVYELFVEEVKQGLDISKVTFLKLDEWYGVAEDAKCTCTTFLNENLFDKLTQKPKQVIEFHSNTKDMDKDLKSVQFFIDTFGIDLMFLGLGMNGHLGLNEPCDHLTLDCHYAPLNEKTKTHDMAKGFSLEGGLTIGMGGIFKAKQIIMLVTGTRKEDAFKAFMSKKITTSIPSSFLWLHPNCITYIDQTSFE